MPPWRPHQTIERGQRYRCTPRRQPSGPTGVAPRSVTGVNAEEQHVVFPLGPLSGPLPVILKPVMTLGCSIPPAGDARSATVQPGRQTPAPRPHNPNADDCWALNQPGVSTPLIRDSAPPRISGIQGRIHRASAPDAMRWSVPAASSSRKVFCTIRKRRPTPGEAGNLISSVSGCLDLIRFSNPGRRPTCKATRRCRAVWTWSGSAPPR